MKALVSRIAGGPETLVLQDRPKPQPRAHEVVIAVKACGVNYPDCLVIEDKYQARPERPFSPGIEVAGVVDCVGEAVTDLRTGDQVVALPHFGGMAESVAVDQARVIPMPDSMSFEVGASILMTYGTSYHALKQRAHLKRGETLLVLGAAGGVGLAAVEIGKATGARVIAAVSSPEKLRCAMEHGADDGVVYPVGACDKPAARALADQFKNAVGTAGADVIYDAVGGDYTEASLRSLGWEGRFLVVGFPAGIPRIPLNLILLKSCQILGVFWGAWTEREPLAHRANVRELFHLYESGALRPHISQIFSLDNARDAIALLASRRSMGKLVVKVN
jgi:NADPH2:quinone reductase